MRAIIYTRVSQDRAGQGRSVSEQEQECRTVCRREGWTVVEVVSDNDVSASRFTRKQRPGYSRLLDLVSGGAGDVLVTWEASRYSRDLATAAALRDLCREHGVLLSYSGRTLDVTTTGDSFTFALDAVLSERASSETRDRVLRAVRANAAAGRPHGKLLYGYARTYDPTTRAFVAQVEHPEHGPIVREVTRRVAAGETLAKVAADLNARGVPAPRSGRWITTQVRRLCVNPAYAGRRVHRGVVLPDTAATWPALVDDALHHALVQRLTDPSRRTNEGRGVTHLLSGIARCGVCDGALRVLPNRGTLSYTCHAPGFHVSRKESAVDELVTRLVVARLARPDLLPALQQDEGEDNAAAEARNLAARLRARLDEHYAAAATGDLSAGGLVAMERLLLPQITEAEQRGQRRLVSPLLTEVAGEAARERWDALSLDQRREVVRELLVVRVLPVGKGRRTFDPASVQVTWRE